MTRWWSTVVEAGVLASSSVVVSGDDVEVPVVEVPVCQWPSGGNGTGGGDGEVVSRDDAVVNLKVLAVAVT